MLRMNFQIRCKRESIVILSEVEEPVAVLYGYAAGSFDFAQDDRAASNEKPGSENFYQGFKCYPADAV